MNVSEKVIVIGLDGAPWNLIKPWVDEGELPTIKQLMENGVWGDLETVVPPLSAPAWVSFSTGKNPGNHGIYNFILKKENSYDILFMNNITQRKLSKRLWDYLNFKGLKSIIVNLMPTYPPDAINGILISDKLTTPSNGDFIYPKDLINELKSKLGKYYVTPLEDYTIGSDAEKFLKQLFTSEIQQIKYLKYLLKKYDWNLAISVFSGSDCIQHAFGNYLYPTHPLHNHQEAEKYKSKVLSLFKIYDELLKYIITNYEDAILFVMSDHGHGPCYKYFNLPIWLKKEEYLQFRKSPTTFVKLFLFTVFFDFAYSIMGKLGVIEKVKHIFLRGKNSGGKSLFDYIFISWKDIDWNKTTAFTIASGGQIYINLKGREPHGIVTSKEYENIRNELKEKLEKIRDPDTGDKVIYKVYKKEEVYSGKYLENAPDLICLPNIGYVIQYPQVYKPKLFELSKVTGSHSSVNELKGIILVHGRGIKKGVNLKMARIYDIAPTILHILGLPVPKDMDGRVLVEIFDKESESFKKPIYVNPDYYKMSKKEFIKSKIKKLKDEKSF